MLASLALIQCVYEKEASFIDAFSPFVLDAVEQIGSACDSMDVQKAMLSDIGSDIPVHIVKQLLKNLEKNGALVADGGNGRHFKTRYSLTSDGRQILNDARVREQALMQDSSALIDSFYSVLRERTPEATRESAEIVVRHIIEKHLVDLSLVEEEETRNGFQNEIASKEDISLFFEFLARQKGTMPHLLEAFQRCLLGAVLVDFIKNRKDQNGLTPLPKELDLTFFIDSNVAISLLGYHGKYSQNAIEDLLKLMRSFRGVKVKILDITIDELKRFFKSYDSRGYRKEIRVDSAYWHMYEKGLNSAAVAVLTDTLQDRLSQKGIELESRSTAEVCQNSARYHDLLADVYTRKSGVNNSLPEGQQKNDPVVHRASEHDAMAIYFIGKSRGQSNGSTFYKCKYVFLTHSSRMVWLARQMQSDRDAIPEVLLDSQVANYLWMIKPDRILDASENRLLAIHERTGYIDAATWHAFLWRIRSMELDGRWEADNTALLFSNNLIVQEDLKQLTYSDISEDVISEMLEKAILEKRRTDEELNAASQRISYLEAELESERRQRHSGESERQLMATGMGALSQSIRQLQANEQKRLEADMDAKADQRLKQYRNRVWIKSFVVILIVLTAATLNFLQAGGTLSVNVLGMNIGSLGVLLGVQGIFYYLKKQYEKECSIWRFFFRRAELIAELRNNVQHERETTLISRG